MPETRQIRVVRQVRSFPKGINSYVDPLLLPRDQLAFATNATMRGNFILQRPNYYRYTLVDTNSGADIAAFQSALYQGGTYYRSGNNGYLMLAVNGFLFQVSPNTSTNVATITKLAVPSFLVSTSYGATSSATPGQAAVTLGVGIAYSISKGVNDTSWSLTGSGTYSTTWPAIIPQSTSAQTFYVKGTNGAAVTITVNAQSSNSQSALQNWLIQAETFIIWNDGQNLPIFYNGSTSRRSLGPTLTTLGITNVDFDAPPQDQYVTSLNGTTTEPYVTLVSPYKGTVPAVVIIGGAQYEITGANTGIAGSTATIFLDSVSGSGSASDYIQLGTGVFLSSAYPGLIVGATQSTFPSPPSAGAAGTQFTVNVLLPVAPQSGNVSIGTTVYDNPYYCGVITAANLGTISSLGGAISVFPVATTTSLTVVVDANLTGNVGATLYLVNPNSSDSLYWKGTITSLSSYSGGKTTAVATTTSSPAAGQTITIGTVSGGLAQDVVYGVSSINASVWPSTGVPSIVVTFSKSFAGAIGDTISIPVTGQTFTSVTGTVAAISGMQVQLTLPGSFATANVAIPIGNTVMVTDTTKPTPTAANSTEFGVSFSTSPAVGSTIQIIMTTVANLVAGQTVWFTATVAGGGTQTIAGVILASQGNSPSSANPANGTFGSAANTFTLTLSQPYTGSTGDVLQVGTGATLAQFSVSSITSAASGVVLCAMVAGSTYEGTIPITTPVAASTTNIVINNTQKNRLGGPSLTLVGTTVGSQYPMTTGSLTASVGLLTSTAATTATANYIVQIAVTSDKAGADPTANSPDLFVVTSVTNGQTSGSPTISLYNINDTEGKQITAGTPIYSLPELPQSRMLAYGMGRVWAAVTDGTVCNSFIAGDTVGSSSGTPPTYEDAILKVSQNYFLANGLTFQISGAGEEITGLMFQAQLNLALGQGPLFVFTDDAVTNCNAPADATTWSTLTSPIVTAGLIGTGGAGQDCIIQENADLIFRTATGGVQSLETASIAFNQWGNTPISNEIIRIIENDPPSLLPYSSTVVFNNRLLMSCGLSQQSRGVIGNTIAVLNFDSISTLQGKQPSIWEGQWTGLNTLQLFTGFFNSAEHCFALCLNGGLLELNEIILDGAATMDNGNAPVVWEFETGMVFDPQSNTPESRSYKRLENGEFSVDEITGDVTIQAFYKPDQYPNWVPWYSTTIDYQGASDVGFRSRLGLGEPAANVFDPTNNRPLREAYDFQVKFIITGACKFLVGRFSAIEIPEPMFQQPKAIV